MVTIMVYAKTTEWPTLEDAVRTYAVWTLECYGAEKERYANVLAKLCLGFTEVDDSDSVDYGRLWK